MNFSSINIQGNIISSEILDKIRTEEKFKHQAPEAFGLARNSSLRDEIGLAWSIMRTHWFAYKKRLETLPKGDTGTSLTREKWIIPLLSELGYEIGIQKAQQINGKSYAISHGATNRDKYPVHIMGYNDHLDKRRETGGPRLSPHALVQEYLNNTEHLYALVTNGRHLRLLRDATRLVRMSYLEFDLERMFEEELYADFSLLYRVLHASRMPNKMEEGPDSVVEYYHQESLASGTRIREKLSEAVEASIKTLANGFLAHKKNEELINQIDAEHLKADTYYTYQLRLIYRILFLIVLEERKLIYPEDATEEQQRYRDIYYKYYSIERLRKLTENRVYVDADKYDLWESLKTTFLLFEEEQFGSKIGIKPLGSGLFAPDALGNLKEQFLSNGELIEVLKRLTTFMNDQDQLVRVNYSDLDVEEFGSVYEGLLEYDPVIEKIGANWEFSFVLGDGRSSSGSHYTPEELVKPLIKHSLDYIIADKLKEANPEEALLSITVCDVACGSGHILLSAARKIATELASIREGAEQPSPTFYRAAIRDVIRNCIYGVDLNPLAVELCKVALWLEAHNPNEPLNFLDHHIKNGNAIVGLAHFEELQNGIANEAFKALPGDDKTLANELKKKNTLEKKTTGQLSTYSIAEVDTSLKGLQKEFADFVSLPENTPEQIQTKTAAYQKLTTGKKWYRLKNLADIQVAQFFIPKTIENKEKITTEAKYRTYLNAGTQILDRGASMAIAQEKRFFHWFLEFPEVFSSGGFDCILGNPPFLGDKKIKAAYGWPFQAYVKANFAPIGSADLVTYFFRRIFNVLRDGAYMSLISTNSISQGINREGGLDIITKEQGGDINYANPSVAWPGEAAVVVTLLTIFKGKFKNQKFISENKVPHISTVLRSGKEIAPPQLLIENENKSFIGNYVLGTGFILSEDQKVKLIDDDPKSREVIFPYLNGKDLNGSPNSNPSRFVINFNDRNEAESSKYEGAYNWVKKNVKPERDKKADKSAREKWWLHARSRPNLYKAIEGLDKVLVIAQVSKTVAPLFVPRDIVYDSKLIVFAINDFAGFGVIQSNFHFHWAWKYGTTMKNDLSYGPVRIFETLPFPKVVSQEFNELATEYYELRKELMLKMNLGLTKFYNEFHNQHNVESGVIKLRELQKELDVELLRLYLNESNTFNNNFNLEHGFYSLDFLPENDNVRYTIGLEARKQILKLLLDYNHNRFEEEVKLGLHKKKDVTTYYKDKNEEIPEGTIYSDSKKSTKQLSKKKKNTIPPSIRTQQVLFEEPDLFTSPDMVSEDCKVSVQKEDGKEFKYHVFPKAVKGDFTGEHKQISNSSKLAEVMLGRRVNDIFVFGGSKYKILEVK